MRSQSIITLTRLEVEEVVDVLPSDLVEVARLLIAGEQPVAVRQRLRITRGKFQRRMERLRVVFRAAGFYNHGIEREAA